MELVKFTASPLKMMTTQELTQKLDQWTPPAEVIISVQDLLIQILIRLPVKPLMQFKSVSKNWKSIITSLQFSIKRNPDPNLTVGLFHRGSVGGELECIKLNANSPINSSFRVLFPDNPDHYWIQQSCDGLLVFCSCGNGYGARAYRRPVTKCYIYNPTTTLFTEIPIPVKENWTVHGVALAFNRSKFPAYKVIAVGTEKGTGRNQIKIYSSETGAWRVSGEPFELDLRLPYTVYWNGATHWVDYCTGEVLFFEVDEEAVSWVPGMNSRENAYAEYFGVSCGRLLLVESCPEEGDITVFEMKTDRSEWFLKYRVDISIIATGCPDFNLYDEMEKKIIYEFYVMTFVLGKGFKDSFVILQVQDKVVKFELGSRRFSEIFDYQYSSLGGSFKFVGPSVVDYVESVICI